MASLPDKSLDPFILQWLMEGDVSIQFQVYRDLLGIHKPELQDRIALEGWGATFLSLREPGQHWGQGFYQPKWISTHYTLLDLKNLSITRDLPEVRELIHSLLDVDLGPINSKKAHRSMVRQDVCVNGMFLNYASYFGAEEKRLESIIDFILSQQLPDGGFNCNYFFRGGSHSSLHSTLSVLEGILEYQANGYGYRLDELCEAAALSRLFLLEHKLFQSHRTGAIIDKRMLMLSYPSRWRYDILRALDYFRAAGMQYDSLMSDALKVISDKQRPDGTWPLQLKHPGQTHFDMEKAGKASRWNTLRALRVMRHFGGRGTGDGG